MVDSGYDFLIPELLNLIFFQQRSVVIFPYVDQKHLKLLEAFTVGHSIIDLDCTSLDDVVSIVEFESGSYSQNPNLYFVYNATKDIIASLQECENIQCIVNTHEDVSRLVDEQALIFYNKKSKKFLNWDFNSQDLSFENELLERSKGNTLVLQDSLLHIKTIATHIYTALVEEESIQSIPTLLSEHAKLFHSSHWDRILEFMESYHKIETPPEAIKKVQEAKTFGNGGLVSQIRTKTPLTDFSSEYELIITVDRTISNAFVQALHEYRSKYVNSANLEISQLYNPKELYNYLRNHHWKNGIDEVFVDEWFKNPDLISEQNLKEVKMILQKLGISHKLLIQSKGEFAENGSNSSFFQNDPKFENSQDGLNPDFIQMPSVKNFKQFRAWILKKLDEIESKI